LAQHAQLYAARGRFGSRFGDESCGRHHTPPVQAVPRQEPDLRGAGVEHRGHPAGRGDQEAWTTWKDLWMRLEGYFSDRISDPTVRP